MHYKNGREAKVGDLIVAQGWNGLPQVGVVVKGHPGTDTCNLEIAPVDNLLTFTASGCLHVDDVFPKEETVSE